MSRKARSFEDAMARLEELVGRLEEGEIGLEESLKAYKEGMSLHGFCQERLRKVEEEVLKVLGEEEAELVEDASAVQEDSADEEQGGLFPGLNEDEDREDELPF